MTEGNYALAWVRLTAHIKEATDGRLSLTIYEIPDLVVHAGGVADIAEVVRSAAAEVFNEPESAFKVEIVY